MAGGDPVAEGGGGFGVPDLLKRVVAEISDGRVCLAQADIAVGVDDGVEDACFAGDDLPSGFGEIGRAHV